MKRKIRPYIKFLFRENFIYICILAVLLILTIVLAPFMSNRIINSNDRVKALTKDVKELENKERILSNVINESGEDIDKDLTLITKLIPDAEDYFSMIYALERLSQSTGFSINSYTVNLTKSTSNKLSLTVIGAGDSQTFLKLLQDYNVGGGRLITAEKIGVDPAQIGSLSLSLNFYNKKATISANEKQDFKASLEQLRAIKSKINFSLTEDTSNADTSVDTSYPIKTTPF